MLGMRRADLLTHTVTHPTICYTRTRRAAAAAAAAVSNMAFVLGTNNHGKGRVRLLKVSQKTRVAACR